jgi:GT2 family glycosyltransferase
MFRAATVQDLSAVTAACLLVKAAVYDEAGGLDEGFAVAFNDVDFCLRVRALGYRVLFTPYAELYHYESKSRGLDTKGPPGNA